MAAVAALEAQDTARKVASALAILSESEPLTMRSPELPVRYLVERRGITQLAAAGAALAPGVPMGATSAWAASLCRCPMSTAT